MQVENSSKRSTKALQPLIDFVAGETKHGSKVHLKLLPQQPPDKKRYEEVGVGIAYPGAVNTKPPKDPIGQIAYFFVDAILAKISPPVVEVHVPTKRDYPVGSCYRKEVGLVPLADWKEEFLFTLAHEFRHVDQFAGPVRTERGLERLASHLKFGEIDAEKFAVKILQKWQKLQGRPIALVCEDKAKNKVSVRLEKARENK